jgi:hypothetical protein
MRLEIKTGDQNGTSGQKANAGGFQPIRQFFVRRLAVRLENLCLSIRVG